MSFVPDPSPCLVEIEGYKAAYYQSNERGCAPLHVIAIGAIGKVGGWIEANDKGIVAIATLVIALFTVTLWFSTHKMWQASQEQLRHSERATEQQLRAYLLHHSVDQAWEFEDPNQRPVAVKFSIKFENTGLTPALDVALYTDTQRVPRAEIGFPRTFKLRPKEPESSKANVGSRVTISTPEFRLSLSDIIDGFKKEDRFLIYTQLSYSDIFDRKWLSECCLILTQIDIPPTVADLLQAQGKSFRPTFEAYPHHNKYGPV